MNFFAHGFHFLDRPHLLAGTALPDWLSVADRGVRLRPRRVEPFRDHDDPVVAGLARGVLRHVHDDVWFHRSAAFYEVNGELTRRIREAFHDEPGYRYTFLGHVLAELLLDAALMETHPDELNEYYAVVNALDTERVQAAVNVMAKRPTRRLAMLIERFGTVQFLRDYLDDERLLYRLNQVMNRVKLKPLPDAMTVVIRESRETLRRQRTALLPPEHFGQPMPQS